LGCYVVWNHASCQMWSTPGRYSVFVGYLFSNYVDTLIDQLMLSGYGIHIANIHWRFFIRRCYRLIINSRVLVTAYRSLLMCVSVTVFIGILFLTRRKALWQRLLAVVPWVVSQHARQRYAVLRTASPVKAKPNYWTAHQTPTLLPINTKLGKINYVRAFYNCAKFHSNQLRNGALTNWCIFGVCISLT